MRDATASSGLEFVHDPVRTERLEMPDVMGAGVGLVDCDGDGDLDVVLRQGGALAPGRISTSAARTDRLFRNELSADSGGGDRLRFVDVTAGSGLDRSAVGMGVAVGDYDSDGRADLYLTNFGPNRLLRGLGDCRFEDVTKTAGAQDDRWSIAASFFDIDRDGRLDLWVGNYVAYPAEGARPCHDPQGLVDYCGPQAFPAAPDRLLHNRGDGRFEDVSAAWGIDAAGADRTLGTVAFDVDRDGRLDLFVAHDAGENHLWIVREDGTLREEGGLRGAAVNAGGVRTGDMGVEVADFNGDAIADLVATHLPSEGMGYWNGGDGGSLSERAASAGVLRATTGGTGFGIAVLDLENDGWPDLYLANGDIHRKQTPAGATEAQVRLDEPDRLLSNQGGRFVDVSDTTPAVSSRSEVGRGVATGDLDNDGDLDLVLTNNGGPARVLLSRASELGRWTGIRLLDAGGLEAIGSEAMLVCSTGRLLWRRAGTDGSYASARDPRIHFGLGGCPDPVRLDVRWPDGTRERFDPPPPGEYHEIRQGSGQPDDAASGVS